MDTVTKIAVTLGDLAFAALGPLGPTAALFVISALIGAAMLLIWRYTSNQKAIAEVRRSIAAHLLSTRLFKDNLSVTFAAQRQIIRDAIRLMGHSVRPMLIMTVPFVLIVVQIGLRYEHRPLEVGEPVNLQATVKRDANVMEAAKELRLPPAVRADPRGPCRIQQQHTIDWRITPAEAGVHVIRFGAGDAAIDMPLFAGDDFARISTCRGGGFWDRLLYSAEPSIPEASMFESVRILYYDKRATPILGYDIHWLITLMVLSIVFALLLKPVFKVHI